MISPLEFYIIYEKLLWKAFESSLKKQVLELLLKRNIQKI